MKILQLCKKMPYPPKDGEAIAILNITKGLHANGHEVPLLAMNTPKHHYKVKDLPKSIQKIAAFQTVFVDTGLSPMDAFGNLFTQKSYNLARFFSKKYKAALYDILQEQNFDVIHLEGLYLAPYIKFIRQYSPAPIVMRAHNVEFEIWERLAKEQKNWLKKRYLNLLAIRMKYFEIRMLNRYDGLVPISVKDEAYFRKMGYIGPAYTIAASVDAERYTVNHNYANWESVFFIGSLDWMPNQKGLLWFLKEVWPQVYEKMPKVKFYIAGRNMPKWLETKLLPGVHMVGEVEHATDFMQSKGIMIVPLFSGSGMRVKIIEAMALGKPIVATSLAAEGIACTHKKNIMLGNNANEFTEHIIELLQNKSLRNEICHEARQFMLQNHDTNKLIQQLVHFYESLIR